MSTSKNISISDKIIQLDQLLEWFESDEVTLELALDKYKTALQLSNDIEAELEQAKNQIEVIKKKFS